MRHISRTHGVNIGWLHDLFQRRIFGITYSRTEAMAADIFTKTFKELPKWQHAIKLIGIRPSGSRPEKPPEPGPRPETEAKNAENLEHLRNGTTASKTKRKKAEQVAVVVCTHTDDWRKEGTNSPTWFRHKTKWKGQTEFEREDGVWTVHDHRHKWINQLRTPDHFPRSDLTNYRSLTGSRRTTIFEMETK